MNPALTPSLNRRIAQSAKRMLLPQRRKCEDFRRIFVDNPTGKAVLGHLRKYCGMDRTTFHADPYVSAYQEGARAVYIEIQRTLRMSPDEIERLTEGEVE